MLKQRNQISSYGEDIEKQKQKYNDLEKKQVKTEAELMLEKNKH